MMKGMSSFLLLLIGLVCFGCQSASSNKASEEAITSPEAPKVEQRIISLSGTLTEVLYAAGLQNNIVAVDITSTYPEAARSIENLGHISQISTEGILSLQPTLIVVEAEQKNNATLQQLENAGVQIAYIEVPQTLDGSLQVLDQIADLTQANLDKITLKQTIEDNKAQLKAILEAANTAPKVLFIYARGSKTLMIGGKNTFAETIIQLAGGEPVANDIEGFKPLTPEGLVAYQPDVLLLFDSGLKSLANEETGKNGVDGLLEIPGIAETPAGQNRAIYTFDGLYLSGFGPRASTAVLELAQKLHLPKTE